MLKRLLVGLIAMSCCAQEIPETSGAPLSVSNDAPSATAVLKYAATGTLAFSFAGLALVNTCGSLEKITKTLALAGLGYWLAKESVRDMGIRWVDVRQSLKDYEEERDAYAQQMNVELTQQEKNVGLALQAMYSASTIYWREVISLASAAILFKSAYNVFNSTHTFFRYR